MRHKTHAGPREQRAAPTDAITLRTNVRIRVRLSVLYDRNSRRSTASDQQDQQNRRTPNQIELRLGTHFFIITHVSPPHHFSFVQSGYAYVSFSAERRVTFDNNPFFFFYFAQLHLLTDANLANSNGPYRH